MGSSDACRLSGSAAFAHGLDYLQSFDVDTPDDSFCPRRTLINPRQDDLLWPSPLGPSGDQTRQVCRSLDERSDVTWSRGVPKTVAAFHASEF
jgi:hypothetical protein